MRTLESVLRDAIEGEVHFDQTTQSVYSVDASIFECRPLGVILPKTKNDLRSIIQIARDFRVSATVRGAATGITGGCIGYGLIIDLSKYFTKIFEINIENEYAICEPGVIQDELNRRLSLFGYRLGPDTSTGNRATLGGMLANNAAGAQSLRYGKMIDHIIESELLLSNGEFISFASVSMENWNLKREKKNKEGNIYQALWEIKRDFKDEIGLHFPSIPRHVSGYNLDKLLLPAMNVSKLIAGSEGTLGIVTQMKLKIVPRLKLTGLLLFFFTDMIDALRQVPEFLQCSPLSLEMIDDQIIRLGRASPLMLNRMQWLQGDPKAIIIMEIEGNTGADLKEKIHESCLKFKSMGYMRYPVFDPHQIEEVMALRKAGLGILLSKRSYSRAIAFLEDISVSPLHLASFMEEFLDYLAAHGKEAGVYGHVGAGCMHVRPYINLRNPGEIDNVRKMMEDISSLLLRYGGSLSGEHGDGWIRSWLNPKMFGHSLMSAFKKVKNAFDPFDLLNPGKIIPKTDQWEDLRARPKELLQSPQLFLDFNSEGGFELAVDLCNGNGLCRKKEGIMCPSFQATNDEFHTTRARAQALRAIIHNREPLENFTGKGMYEVMDLCLSCKGCKTECPSQVDMAKLKSEFLFHYQEKYGYSLRNRIFGHIGLIHSWMSRGARFFNWVNRLRITKRVLKKIGISSKRSLPSLALEKFSTWFSTYPQGANFSKTVVVLNDTFTEFNHPEIGQATVRLLNALGYFVILPKWRCCGRPAFSKGMLPTAQKQAEQLVENLKVYASKKYPIIGLEPSCLLTIRDDYPSLLTSSTESKGQILGLLAQCVTLDEFLADIVEKGELELSLFKIHLKKVRVHGHCYQKALVGMRPTLNVLKKIPGLIVEEIASGCCGMAGSFGYEQEHETISMKIGELHLFPSIRESDPEDWIIANGMSCRHQIRDGTGRKSLHLAEALVMLLKA